MSVDWTQQLWPASYKGVPFWCDRDDEKGGRRLAVHEFPKRDDPFIEDLGQKAKPFSVTAYLVGDASMGDASTLSSTFDSAGSGTLVLPSHGPIANCYCESFTRNRSKDKMGYIGFDASFWRDGPANQSATAPYLQQLVYDAIGAVSTPAAALAASLVTSGPAYIADNVVTGFEDNIAALEVIRAESSVNADQVQAITSQLTTLYASVPARVSQESGVDGTLASDTLAAAQAIASAMPAASAASTFGLAYDAAAPQALPVTTTANQATDAANQAQLLRLQRLAMLTGYVQGVIASTYASRPDGISARSALVARFDVELGQCQGAADMDLSIALENLRATAITYLQKLIVTLAPIVIVSAGRSLPSLWWAWRLYQDPTRAPEIVARNRVPHPSFCPMQLEVLAPSAPAPNASLV